MQHPWMTLFISALIIGLFIYLVYFGMFRFHSRKNFYSFWLVMLMIMTFSCYFPLRAGTYILFLAPVVTTALMFIRDWKKLNRLAHENKIQ